MMFQARSRAVPCEEEELGGDRGSGELAPLSRCWTYELPATGGRCIGDVIMDALPFFAVIEVN
jgi:hypothetical protein